MFTPRRRPVFVAAALICMVFVGQRARAEPQPTDDEAIPTVETSDGVTFTIPAAIRAPVDYQFTIEVTSDREQGVILYQWAQDDNAVGRWQKRAFYDTYFQGKLITAVVPLEGGRTYLLVAFNKDASPVGWGLPWAQSEIRNSQSNVADPTRPVPTITAHFEAARGSTTTVTLSPTGNVPVPGVMMVPGVER